MADHTPELFIILSFGFVGNHSPSSPLLMTPGKLCEERPQTSLKKGLKRCFDLKGESGSSWKRHVSCATEIIIQQFSAEMKFSPGAPPLARAVELEVAVVVSMRLLMVIPGC